MAFDGDYSNRKGFDSAFLRSGKQDGQVFLPQLSPALAKKASPLIANPKDNVLPYRHFSVVMHKARRFAIYSAANVDFSGRFQLTRPKDVWRFDPAHRSGSAGRRSVLREQPVRPRPPDPARRPGIRGDAGQGARRRRGHLPLEQLHAAARSVQ